MNPDAQVIYDDAVEMQGRCEEYGAKRVLYNQRLRDTELELLLDRAFAVNLVGEERVAAAKAAADQAVQKKYAQLYNFIAREGAAIDAMRVRNEGIVAAGWAEQFALNRVSHEFRQRLVQDETRELEAGSDE